MVKTHKDAPIIKSWDELIEERNVIKQVADKLNVSQNYLTYQTDFLKGVTLNNKYLAVNAINKAKERLIELS